MTVHGAKGLEAPVVFLVDGAGAPLSSRQEPKFLELPTAATPLMLLTPRKDDRPALAQDAADRARAQALEEHRRLLYVALTRAADRLVLAGHSAGCNRTRRAGLSGCAWHWSRRRRP